MPAVPHHLPNGRSRCIAADVCRNPDADRPVAVAAPAPAFRPHPASAMGSTVTKDIEKLDSGSITARNQGEGKLLTRAANK